MRFLLPFLLTVAACHLQRDSAPVPKRVVALPEVVKGAHLRPVQDERRGYGTKQSRQTMVRLHELGVNTIGILLEGNMDDLASTEVLAPPKRQQEAITAALEDANGIGLATVLIPHIYFNDGSWRGDLSFDDETALDAWWRSYSSFMDVAARIAAGGGASMLSLGVELKAMSSDPDTRRRMAELAKRVRADYEGLLTYSANWDEAEDVAFWNVVDVAGVNGYYPLQPEPFRGAEVVGRRLSALADSANRPVLVLEVGFRSSPLPHVRPWEWPDHVDPVVDVGAQARAWAAVLTHWYGAPGVRGLMVWVIPTDPDDPASEPLHGFSPINKPAEEVIGRVFR